MGFQDSVVAVSTARRAFRNWHTFIARIVSGAVRGVPKTTVAHTRKGTTIYCPNTPMARAPLWEVFASDDYPWSLIVAGLHRTSPLVIDVGAHVGAFILGLQELRPDVRGMCFEPSETTYSFLERNITANGRAGTVIVRSQALADQAGEITFWEAEPGSCVNSSVRVLGAVERRVDAVTLESIVDECGEQVDLLKLDCEGAEHAVIRATPGDVWDRVDAVFLEYHPSDSSGWDDLRRVLEEHGLEVRWERSELNGVEGLGLAYLSRR